MCWSVLCPLAVGTRGDETPGVLPVEAESVSGALSPIVSLVRGPQAPMIVAASTCLRLLSDATPWAARRPTTSVGGRHGRDRGSVPGLDVHKQTVTAAVRSPGPGGAGRRQEIREFATFTADLVALRDWLAAEGVTQVAIEATGVYWKPVVRHEPLHDREGMEGPLLRAVAAVG